MSVLENERGVILDAIQSIEVKRKFHEDGLNEAETSLEQLHAALDDVEQRISGEGLAAVEVMNGPGAEGSAPAEGVNTNDAIENTGGTDRGVEASEVRNDQDVTGNIQSNDQQLSEQDPGA